MPENDPKNKQNVSLKEMINRIFRIVSVFIILFIVLLLDVYIVIFFSKEQTKGINEHNKYQIIGFFQRLRSDIMEGGIRMIDKNKYDKSIEELIDYVQSWSDLSELGTLEYKFNEIVNNIKRDGGEATIIDKYRHNFINKIVKNIKIISWGSKISVIFYGIIFILVFISLIHIVFNSPRIQKKNIKDIELRVKNFTGFALSDTIENISYVKELAKEYDTSIIEKTNRYLNNLINLGLLGTLFGLALAFYTAASSFPSDLERVLETEENKTVVILGLIQTIYNYSFAVITSLVAYSLATCLRVINSSIFTSAVKKLNELIDKNKLIGPRVIMIERIITDTVKILVEQIPTKEVLKEKIEMINSYITNIISYLKEDLENIRNSISQLNNKVNNMNNSMNEEYENMKNRITQLEIVMRQFEMIIKELSDSGAKLGRKIENIVQSMEGDGKQG